ncbi:MAG TPA: putative quinol monooxygenase [Stellaceae bacterium]|nr:putative quinol monooxygenase [Stellaceae bacterium]
MLAVIATIKVKPGMEKDFEREALALAREVNAKEPGCKLYTLSRGEAAHTYIFMERYVDQAAVEHHRGTAYFKEIGRKMGAFMDGKPEIQRLTELS